MNSIPVFFKRKLIGHYEGPFYGDDFCILTSKAELPNIPGVFGYFYVIANILYDRHDKKAGLEVAWLEGLEFIEGYSPLS